jgi:hypothetical protein
MAEQGPPPPWPYGWIAFGAACAAVMIGVIWGLALCRLLECTKLRLTVPLLQTEV